MAIVLGVPTGVQLITGVTMSVNGPEETGLMSVQEAATYLSISLSWLRQALARGEFPMVKIGSRTLLRKSVLDAYITQHEVS
jgi:excisionase family DNA binding protein